MIQTELMLAGLVKSSPEAVMFHLYARSNPYGDEKNHDSCIYRRIIVDKNFGLSVDPNPYNGDELMNARAMLYKSCPADTSGVKHYIFGDIIFTKDKNKISKNSSNFFFDDDMDTFTGATKDLFSEVVLHPFVKAFRESFLKNISAIKEIISATPFDSTLKSLYFYFDFQKAFGKKHWYEFDGVLPYMDELETNYFEILTKTPQGFVFNEKTYIHTLCSGNDKNDEQCPGFDSKNQYKCLSLTKEDAGSIFYLQGILKKCETYIPKCNPYKFRLLPSGKLSFDDFKGYINSLPKFVSMDKTKEGDKTIEKAEEEIKRVDVKDPFEDIDSSPKNIKSFDLILIMKGGMSSPDINIQEWSNINRSNLSKVIKKIKENREDVKKDSGWMPHTVCVSFYNILNMDGIEKAKNQPRYKAHMIKVLPRILSGTYYSDPGLVNRMVGKILFKMRNGLDSDNEIKSMLTDFRFILKLQKGGDPVFHEKSSELGKQAASVAFPLERLFKDFRKQTIGYLDRRAMSTDNVRGLLREWEQKISRHLNENKNGFVCELNGYALSEARRLNRELEIAQAYDRNSFIEGFLDHVGKLSYIQFKKNQQ